MFRLNGRRFCVAALITAVLAPGWSLSAQAAVIDGLVPKGQAALGRAGPSIQISSEAEPSGSWKVRRRHRAAAAVSR